MRGDGGLLSAHSLREEPVGSRSSVQRLPAERVLPSAVLATSAGLFAFFPEARLPAAPLPFLLALVFLGLPHGAADGALLLTRGRQQAVRASVAYLAVIAATVLLLVVAPTWSLLAFLALAAWHFGSADAAERRLRGELANLWAIGRGGIAISVPFAVWPAEAWAPFSRMTELLGIGSAGLDLQAVAIVGAVGAVAATACCCVAYLRCRRSALVRGGITRVDVMETTAIGAVAFYSHPLYAVGAYFLMIHGFKQSAVLGEELGSTPSLRSRLVRLHWFALPLLVPTWITLLFVAWWVGVDTLWDLAALSLAIYVVTTPAHELLHRRLVPPRWES